MARKRTRGNQRDIILAYLQAGGSLTQWEARSRPFRCLRLAARIEELRRDGHQITTTMVAVRGHENLVAEYAMEPSTIPPRPPAQSSLNL